MTRLGLIAIPVLAVLVWAAIYLAWMFGALWWLVAVVLAALFVRDMWALNVALTDEYYNPAIGRPRADRACVWLFGLLAVVALGL